MVKGRSGALVGLAALAALESGGRVARAELAQDDLPRAAPGITAQKPKKPKHPRHPKRPPPGAPAPPLAPPLPQREPARPVRAPSVVVDRSTLENGLRVVLAPDPRAPVVTVVLAYDVGARVEDRGATGVSNMFSHLLVQGSANVLRGEHERLASSRGGEAFVAQSVDRVVVGTTGPAAELPLFLWLEADRLKSLSVTQEGLDAQRKIVQAERASSLGAPLAAARDRLRELVFQGLFAYEHDPRGASADVAAMRLEVVRAFHETWATASNAVLVVTGAFEAEHGHSLVRRFFETAKKVERPAATAFPQLPEQTSARAAAVEDARLRAPVLLWGWAIPPAGTEDHDALVAGLDTLVGGPSSRLWQRLVVERGLAVDVRGSVEQQRGLDLLRLEVALTEESGKADAVRIVDAELEALAKSGPGDAEMASFRARVEHRVFTTLARSDDRARHLAALELIHGDARAVAGEAARLAGVTRERVKAAVARHLAPSRRSLVEAAPPRDGEAPPKKPASPGSTPGAAPPIRPPTPKSKHR